MKSLVVWIALASATIPLISAADECDDRAKTAVEDLNRVNGSPLVQIDLKVIEDSGQVRVYSTQSQGPNFTVTSVWRSGGNCQIEQVTYNPEE